MPRQQKYKPAVPAPHVQRFYAGHGFHETGTGGNCTAFEKRLDAAGLYILVTVHDDAEIPAEIAQPVIAGLYISEGEDTNAIAEIHAPDSQALMSQIAAGRWVRS